MAASEPTAIAPALLICCSALLREILDFCKLNQWSHYEIQTITAELHNRPEKIPAAVKQLIDVGKQRGQQIFVGYADCGTGGLLDALLERENVERLPGAHCYEFYAGSRQFADFQEQQLGTFYLTDFLVRHFDRLVIRGLGLDRKPELLPVYFGNYRKLLYLAQSDDPKLQQQAQQAAVKLGLEYQYQYSGSGGLGHALSAFNQKIPMQLVQ
ncbi:MAG: hypothetical protein OFPI_39550 [Osedax symbiont Rs2]|nr:MAG: hypothetical protein OFPI_39550 [Osedax symbiont Rs2]